MKVDNPVSESVCVCVVRVQVILTGSSIMSWKNYDLYLIFGERILDVCIHTYADGRRPGYADEQASNACNGLFVRF